MKLIIQFSLIILVITVSCSRNITSVSDVGLKDGKYDSDYFSIKEGEHLKQLIPSVKIINVQAYYETYYFESSSNISLNDVRKIDVEPLSIDKNYITETASGTATVINSSKGKVTLLTCAHILDFPDTLINYFKTSTGENTKFIESISIKVRQTTSLPEILQPNRVNILLVDSELDIAIVGKEISPLSQLDFPPLKVTIGNSNELTWGSKVYIIGHPLNYKMVTNGLVSPSQSSESGYFLVDAVFNRGFSGGVVLAIRDGAPNFEIVGMVKSGTVDRKFSLKPNVNSSSFSYQPLIPYQGELFVEEETTIKYGVTKIMTFETVVEFINDNNDLLYELGYSLSPFLEK